MKKLIIIFLWFTFHLLGEDLGYLVNDLNQSNNVFHNSEEINFIFNIKNKNYEKVELFLSKYENIDFVIKNNNTLLFYAIDLGDLKVVKLLIEHGANLYHINNNLETTLHIAVKRDTVEITRYLLEEGITTISNKDFYGNTALFYANKNANNEIIELLKYYKTINIKEIDDLEDFIKNF